MKLTDIEYIPGNGKGFHSFRRYVASSMINNEVPVDTVKRNSGSYADGLNEVLYAYQPREVVNVCA